MKKKSTVQVSTIRESDFATEMGERKKVIFRNNIETHYESVDGHLIDVSKVKEVGQQIGDSGGNLWEVESWSGSRGTFSSSAHGELHIVFKKLEEIGYEYKIDIDGINLRLVMPDYSEPFRAEILGLIRENLLSIPRKGIDAISEIIIHPFENVADPYWRATYNRFTKSAATGGNGELSFYPLGRSIEKPYDNKVIFERIMQHEFGHLLAHKLFGSTTPPQRWIDAAKKDGTFVRDYSKNSWGEDFADSVAHYLKNYDRYDVKEWNKFKNRFEFLDEILLDNPQDRAELLKLIKARKEIKGLAVGVTTVAGGSYILYQGYIYIVKVRAGHREENRQSP